MSQSTPQVPLSAEPSAAPIRRTKSGWLWLRLVVLTALLLLSSVLALFGSNPGLQLLWLLQPHLLPALQMQAVSGDLWQGVRIKQLQYQQPDLQVAVAELALKVDLSCLWQRQLCLPLVQVTQLQVSQTVQESTLPGSALPRRSPASASPARWRRWS